MAAMQMAARSCARCRGCSGAAGRLDMRQRRLFECRSALPAGWEPEAGAGGRALEGPTSDRNRLANPCPNPHRGLHAGGCGRRLVVFLLRAAAGGEGAPGPRAAGAAMAVPVETAPVAGRADPAPPRRRRHRCAPTNWWSSGPRWRGGSSRSASRRASRSSGATSSCGSTTRSIGPRCEQAQAALDLSQANYERAIDLLRRGAGTTKARDEAIAQLRANEAALDLAQARMDKTVHQGAVRRRGGPAQRLGRRFRRRRAGHRQSRADRPAQGRFPRRREVPRAPSGPGQTIEVSVDAFPGESVRPARSMRSIR